MIHHLPISHVTVTFFVFDLTEITVPFGFERNEITVPFVFVKSDITVPFYFDRTVDNCTLYSVNWHSTVLMYCSMHVVPEPVRNAMA